jgi:hypothetical protein
MASRTAERTRTAVATGTAAATATPPPSSGCALSQGYWKNHAGAWPVQALTLGTVNYTQAQLIGFLQQPPRGDASLILAKQLIAAKLNTANGAGGAEALILNADRLLAAFTGPLPYHIKTTSSPGTAMVTSADALATFNESCDQSVRRDSDGDGYDDDRETDLGMDPLRYCGIARADVLMTGRVTLADLSYTLLHAFDSNSTWRLDQNGDGRVNILDIVIEARYWGESVARCP